MSIKLGDNIQVQIPKPLDSKYLNDTISYTGTSQVNTCIASGLRSIGLTVNIANVEYWYGQGILDSCLVTKSAASTWGNITGTLSTQTDLQTCLNSKLASGGTAICATTAINSKALCGCVPSCFLGATACAVDSAKFGNKLPAYYLNTGSTTLMGQLNILSPTVNNVLSITNCAASNLCGNPAISGVVNFSFANSGSAYNSYNFKGANSRLSFENSNDAATGSFFMSYSTMQFAFNNYNVLGLMQNGKVGSLVSSTNPEPTWRNILDDGNGNSSFLLSGGTSICTTSAINSKALCGCVPLSFLLSGGTAVNSAKLGGQLPAYYLNSGSTITCAADSAKLNNKLPAYYLNTGSTAICATCAIGAKNLCGCVPSCFLGATACANDSNKLNNHLSTYYLNTGSTIALSTCATTAGNALNLGNVLPAGYLLSGGTAINSKALCGCAPSCFLGVTACANDSQKLGNHLPAYYLNTGSTAACACDSAKLGGILPTGYLLSGSTAVCSTSSINSLALCGCVPSCFLGATACASDSNKLNNKLPTYYLNTGSTALCSTTAGNSLALCGCTPACFLGATACANDSAKLNNKLPTYYLNTGSTAICATSSINSLALCGCIPSCFLGATATACCAVTAGNALCLGGQLPSYYLTATAGLTGATNGISTTGQKVCLGGALIAGTSITGNQALYLGTVASNLASLDLHSAGNTTIVAGVLLMSSSGATFTDLTLTTKQGIKYAQDYSLTYDSRSLVDKGYVDSVAVGLNPHASVVVATTTPITLIGNQTIDGVLTTTGMRVLVKNQTLNATNGIYSASTSTWGRTVDYDNSPSGEITNGDLIPITSGNTQNNSIWVLTTPNPIIVNVTSLIFTQFSTIIDVQAGAGIAITQVGGIHTVCALLGSNCGLSIAGTGLCVNSGIAGSCLSYSSGVLNVCASCFLAVGGTAVCATSAINSKALCGCVPLSFLLSGGTAVCATCAGNASTVAGCTPACFLGVNACAADSTKLNNKSASYYLNTGSTITCSADSAKLNNKLPAYYLNTGSTAICAICAGNASTLVGCIPSCFLGVNATAVCATCAIGAKNLCGCVPASFLLSGGTAICATSSINSLALCGCIPSCFLGATSCAVDSQKLGNHLPSYYLSSGGTAICACDSAKLGGILPAGYMLTGATYSLSSPATKCVGGVCVNDILTGKTAFQLFQQILAPELFPTSLVAPSTSINLSPATLLYEIGCSISALCIIGTFNCGSINPQYCSSSSCRSGLANCYNFTGCQVVGSYACNTSSLIKCATTYVICASQTWGVSTCFDIGAQPKGSAGSNYCTPLAAGITSAANINIVGIYPYYWGKLTSGSRPAVTSSLVTGGTKILANSTGTVTISFGSGASDYTWLAIPLTSTSKTCWYVSGIDNGFMNRSCASDKYPDECQICVSSGQLCWSNVCYKVYMSGAVGAIISPMEFRNS